MDERSSTAPVVYYNAVVDVIPSTVYQVRNRSKVTLYSTHLGSYAGMQPSGGFGADPAMPVLEIVKVGSALDDHTTPLRYGDEVAIVTHNQQSVGPTAASMVTGYDSTLTILSRLLGLLSSEDLVRTLDVAGYDPLAHQFGADATCGDACQWILESLDGFETGKGIEYGERFRLRSKASSFPVVKALSISGPVYLLAVSPADSAAERVALATVVERVLLSHPILYPLAIGLNLMRRSADLYQGSFKVTRDAGAPAAAFTFRDERGRVLRHTGVPCLRGPVNEFIARMREAGIEGTQITSFCKDAMRVYAPKCLGTQVSVWDGDTFEWVCTAPEWDDVRALVDDATVATLDQYDAMLVRLVASGQIDEADRTAWTRDARTAFLTAMSLSANVYRNGTREGADAYKAFIDGKLAARAALAAIDDAAEDLEAAAPQAAGVTDADVQAAHDLGYDADGEGPPTRWMRDHRYWLAAALVLLALLALP